MTNKFEAIEKASKGEITIEMRPVYVVSGANHAYLSQGGALNKLAYIIAEKQFRAEGKPTNYPDEETELEDGTPANKTGEITPEYLERKNEVLNELKAAMRHENEIVKLNAEYEKAKNNATTAQEKLSIASWKLKSAINK
ncbi:TPA: hypothetical protein ON737_001684 [Morganella morganii]|nr:hypothetical protein [Morganella morganii]HCR3555836.1 hypothetical protein [Morganella morganii]HCR3760700.1 hypothetical protein [Morganella morganii]HCT5325731.1 hypothetical protein [Morganella morganii]HEI8515367.1 hypothetical protein [Morganella morganii]